MSVVCNFSEIHLFDNNRFMVRIVTFHFVTRVTSLRTIFVHVRKIHVRKIDVKLKISSNKYFGRPAVLEGIPPWKGQKGADDVMDHRVIKLKNLSFESRPLAEDGFSKLPSLECNELCLGSPTSKSYSENLISSRDQKLFQNF